MRYDEKGALLMMGQPDYLKEYACQCNNWKAERVKWVDSAFNFVEELQAINWRDVEDVEAQREPIRRLKAFIQAPTGWVYLYGRPGNGKTTLAALTINMLRADKREACFAHMPTVLEYLRHCYQTGQESESALEFLRSVPVLAIDGLQEQKITEWTTEQEFQLINYRYTKRKSTIITSNIAPRDLAGEALASRCSDVNLVDAFNLGDGDIRQVKRGWWNNDAD
jgi:DNA replication protein DnaC